MLVAAHGDWKHARQLIESAIGTLESGGDLPDAIFARLSEREATHVGADTGIGVLITIDRALDVRGKPIV